MNYELEATVPVGQRGRWRIETYSVTRDEAMLSGLRDGARCVSPGTYKRLMRGGTVVMSDTPAEKRDHYEPVVQAGLRGGRILIHGLGLGMVLGAILKHGNVTGVDVVELDEDVIALVGSHFNDPRLKIHRGDAYTYKFPSGTRWTVAWHDIWDNLCGDNLPQMEKLHRRYGRRVDWQGSWGREYIRYRLGRY